MRNDPVHTTVAGVPALAFHGFDAAMGQTYEVWFIHGELEPGLNQVLATWRFTK
jgi:hypothetical protein